MSTQAVFNEKHGHSPVAATVEREVQAAVDGYREGLRAWQKSCPCCFSAAHPEGLEAAVQAQK